MITSLVHVSLSSHTSLVCSESASQATNPNAPKETKAESEALAGMETLLSSVPSPAGTPFYSHDAILLNLRYPSSKTSLHTTSIQRRQT